MIAIGAGPVSSAVWQWSTTAASNASADPTINWAESMSPSSVNDSARAMMQQIAYWRDSLSGKLVSGGTSSAYTLTTNLSLASTPSNGQMIAFTPHVTNAASATIAMDGGTAFPINATLGSAVPANMLTANSPYVMKFDTTSGGQWLLMDNYANPYVIPLGGILMSTSSSAPNSNFLAADGRCISTTTYATYWALIGSPAPGACSAGNFALLDARARNMTPLDNMGTAQGAAGRLTAAGGCGTFASLGVTCSLGVETRVMTSSQMPSHYHVAGIYDPTHAHNSDKFFQVSPGSGGVGGGGAFGFQINTSTTFSATGVRVNSSNGLDTTYSAGSSAAMSTLDPNVGVYAYVRVL